MGQGKHSLWHCEIVVLVQKRGYSSTASALIVFDIAIQALFS